jgi:hypothetical protein
LTTAFEVARAFLAIRELEEVPTCLRRRQWRTVGRFGRREALTNGRGRCNERVRDHWS